MAKLQKTKNKEATLIVRVNPELKTELRRLAELDSRTLGDYIRLKLKQVVEDSKADETKKK